MSEEFVCNSRAPANEIPDEFKTFSSIIQTQTEKMPNRRFCGTREFLSSNMRGPYEWYSYLDCYHQVKFLTDFLNTFEKGTRIGIISANRTEWTIVDIACAAAGLVLVPIYDT